MVLRKNSAMESNELAFYPTTDLIQELVQRRTFLGLIVHSENELRNGRWNEEEIFKVHLNNNLDPAMASRLLGIISEYLMLHNGETS